MPDTPASLPIRAISETLIQSVGVLRDMLEHSRELLENRWTPQRGQLRTFPSAQSLVECARKLQTLIDTFQGSFGELKQASPTPMPTVAMWTSTPCAMPTLRGWCNQGHR